MRRYNVSSALIVVPVQNFERALFYLTGIVRRYTLGISVIYDQPTHQPSILDDGNDDEPFREGWLLIWIV